MSTSTSSEKAAASAVKSTLSPALTPTFTAKDYSVFFAAGAICCTLSHGGMTPIDGSFLLLSCLFDRPLFALMADSARTTTRQS